jgi:hypothetical protein
LLKQKIDEAMEIAKGCPIMNTTKREIPEILNDNRLIKFSTLESEIIEKRKME